MTKTFSIGGEMDSQPAVLESADIQKVLEVLPHRYPLLMVDRIIDIDEDKSCIGIKNITVNEPQFTGHFPGTPIMPGVLLIEGMAQTAGALCVIKALSGDIPNMVYFMTIDNAKFRKPVIPGDRVEYHMTKIRNRKNIWWFSGKAMVDGTKVAEAEISAMIVGRDSE